jgi:hypothetical protein
MVKVNNYWIHQVDFSIAMKWHFQLSPLNLLGDCILAGRSLGFADVKGVVVVSRDYSYATVMGKVQHY